MTWHFKETCFYIGWRPSLVTADCNTPTCCGGFVPRNVLTQGHTLTFSSDVTERKNEETNLTDTGVTIEKATERTMLSHRSWYDFVFNKNRKNKETTRWRPSLLGWRPLLLEAKKFLVASLLLVVRPGAPSSVLAPSSEARSPSFLLLLVRLVRHLLLEAMHLFLVASCYY